MRKIANAHELVGELERLLDYAGTYQPSRAKLAAELQALSERVASDVPKDLEDMLNTAVPKVKQMSASADLSDKKVMVALWGFLHGLFITWAQGSGPNYEAKERMKLFPSPPSDESKKWIKTVTDARMTTLIRKALKRHWPEALEASIEHGLK